MELVFAPHLRADPIMLIPRFLIDDCLAKDVFGLGPNWMNEEKPLILGRVVLVPLM